MMNLKLVLKVKNQILPPKNQTRSILLTKNAGQTEYRGVGLGPNISSSLYSLLELKRPPKTPITHTCITFGLWVGLKGPLDVSVQLKSLLVFKF